MPRTTIIDNPILNSPYEEPQRHFRFDEAGKPVPPPRYRPVIYQTQS